MKTIATIVCILTALAPAAALAEHVAVSDTPDEKMASPSSAPVVDGLLDEAGLADPQTGVATPADLPQKATTPPEQKPTANSAQLTPRTWQDIDEVLDLLVEMGLLDPADEQVRERVIQSVLEAVGGGATVYPEGADGKPVEDGETTGDAAAAVHVVTLRGTFGFYSVTGLGKTQCEQFIDSLEAVREGHYEGLLLDLREAGGNGFAGANEAAQILAETGVPTVLLVNGATRGAAERLAKLMRRKAKALLIGSSTRGRPFPLRKHELTGGGDVYVPDAGDSGQGTWPPAPLTPDIRVDPPLTTEKLQLLAGLDDLEDRIRQDPALRKASDLLVAVRGLAADPGPQPPPEETE